MRHFWRYDAAPIGSLIAVCAYPCLFMYARNADEVPASSMIPFLLVFLVTGLVLMGVFSIFFRNVSRAAFLSDLSMLVVINFCLLASYVKQALPFMRDRYLLLLLGLLLVLIFLWLLRKKPDLRVGCVLLLIAFGAMIVMNLVLALPTIVRGSRAEQAQPDSSLEPTGVEFTGETPNVYWILFDEYGGYENLLRYYDYDNTPFLNEMESRGFSVAWESRNTEAVATDTIMPNLLNLSYVVRLEDSGHTKKVYRDNTFMTRMFLENGYRVNLVNHVDYLGQTGCRVLTRNQTRRTISEYLMRNSIFNKSDFLRELLDQFFVVDYGANYRESLDNAMEAALNSWEYAQEGPTLTLAYIQCPHSPTMVGPHGEELDYANGWNWRKKELYLGQVSFINDYILTLTDTILAHDPDALIFLQSDHGNRYAIHMMQMKEWDTYDPYEENPYMQNILNCVYYRGQSYDIEGLTGINTMRLLFREVLGADLPEVEPVYDYSMGYEDEQN